MKRLAAAACLIALPFAAHAQSWPAKPIRTVMTVGGGLDLVARIVAGGLSEALGQPVTVEAQSGAGGAVGADTVMRAAPDGHTLMLAGPQTLIVRKFLVKNTSYDVEKSFTPVGQVAETTPVIVASTALPVASFREMIEYGKKNPRQVYFGTSGIGTSHHFSAEAISQLTGLQWIHVPYKGGPQLLGDVMSGKPQVGFTILASALPFVKNADRIRIIAANSNTRHPTIPDVPTVGEIIPGYERPPAWNAYFAPAGTPQPIVRRVNGELVKIIARPEARAKMQAVGFLPVAGSPEDLAAMVTRDVAIVGAMVKRLGLKTE